MVHEWYGRDACIVCYVCLMVTCCMATIEALKDKTMQPQSLPQLKYWKEGAPEDVRSEKKVLQKFKPCHDMPGDSRWRRSFQDDVQEISVDGLWPYTTVHAGVAVLNGAKASHFSNVVSFTTPEGSASDGV